MGIRQDTGTSLAPSVPSCGLDDWSGNREINFAFERASRRAHVRKVLSKLDRL